MELTLTRQAGTQVAVTCDGQPSHSFDLPPLPDEKKLLHSPDYPIAYGKTLYTPLFPTETAAQRTLANVPERILLVTTDPDLDAIPWEYAYGPDGFLVLDCPFVRGLPVGQRISSPALQDTNLHIVAIPSNPLSHLVEPLDIDGEWMRLRDIIQEIPESIALERTRPPTIEQVRHLVAGKRHRVVHFMGHGGRDAQGGAILCFEQDNGDLAVITARELVQRVRNYVFLVTLNACKSATPGETHFSNLAAALVRQKIPYALGMRFNIYDDDARTFSREFYGNLARGTSVEEALLQARLTLSHSKRPWVIGVPVLYTSLAEPAAGFASHTGSPVIIENQPRVEAGVLPRAEGTFQGRIDELKALGTALTGDSRPRIITIHGGGGQGKTALAREAAERFAYAWPGGVWATTLENLPSREVFVNDLARFLKIDTQKMPDPREVERLVIGQLAHRRTLIVLDNTETLIEDVEANNTAALQLVDFIKQLPGSFVSLLVTSREHLGWSGEVAYELGGLLPEEGAMLFQQSAPQRANEVELALAEELSQKLEGHPFSLRLLGGAFNASPIRLHVFIKEWDAQLLQAENKYLGPEHRHRKLYSCIEISVRYLNAELRALLSGLWVFRTVFLPEVAVVIFDSEKGDSEYSPSWVRNHLHTLWQRSLLAYETVTVNEGTLQFYHLLPTMRPYVKHHLAQIYEHDMLLAKFGAAYSQLANFLHHELDRGAAASVVSQRVREDLEQAAEYVTGIQQGYYLLWWSRILHRLGDSRRGLKLLERALEIAQGQDQALEFQVLNNMALMYQATGKSKWALELYEKNLPLIREMGDPVGISTVLHNMAGSYQTMEERQRALQLYEEALQIRRKLGNRAKLAATLDNMAGLYAKMGERQQALQLYEEALHLMRDAGDRAGEAATLNGIASLFSDMSQFEDALATFEQSIVLERQVSHRAGEAAGLVEMALVLYRHLKRTEGAIGYMEQAITVLMQTDLPQDAARRPIEKLQGILQAMRTGVSI